MFSHEEIGTSEFSCRPSDMSQWGSSSQICTMVEHGNDNLGSPFYNHFIFVGLKSSVAEYFEHIKRVFDTGALKK